MGPSKSSRRRQGGCDYGLGDTAAAVVQKSTQARRIYNGYFARGSTGSAVAINCVRDDLASDLEAVCSGGVCSSCQELIQKRTGDGMRLVPAIDEVRAMYPEACGICRSPNQGPLAIRADGTIMTTAQTETAPQESAKVEPMINNAAVDVLSVDWSKYDENAFATGSVAGLVQPVESGYDLGVAKSAWWSERFLGIALLIAVGGNIFLAVVVSCGPYHRKKAVAKMQAHCEP
jgi:hypothetical protein